MAQRDKPVFARLTDVAPLQTELHRCHQPCRSAVCCHSFSAKMDKARQPCSIGTIGCFQLGSITRMNERERLAALGASLCFSPCHETTPANRFAFKNRPVVCLFIQTGFRMVVWGEILCAMDQHQLAPNVQEPGCRPLLQLALHHGENKKENGEAGGIRVIIRAMENHQWVLPTFTRTDVPGFVHFGQKIMTPRMRSGDSGGM